MEEVTVDFPQPTERAPCTECAGKLEALSTRVRHIEEAILCTTFSVLVLAVLFALVSNSVFLTFKKIT